MNLFHKSKTLKEKCNNEIVCPIDGEVVSITNVDDPVFSKKMLGDGIMIRPKDNVLYAPVDGVVEMIFPTKHAIGLRLADGSAILIHVGLDTVALNGKGFSLHIKEKDNVKKGTLMMELDIPYIKEHAKDDCIIMVLQDLPKERIFTFCEGIFVHGESIMKLS